MTVNTEVPSSARTRLSVLDVVLLLAVVCLGLVNLGQPFIWDGAFFTLCAKKLAAGGKLYRDVWDVKQPGLFWFFETAGRLFGFHEIGVRALDVIWMSTLALTMRVALGRWFARAWFASLAALFSIGYAYAFAAENHLSQVEWLAGLPMFVTLWTAWRARGAERGRLPWCLASGVSAGVVLSFKLAFLPLVAALWAVVFWPGVARDASGRERALTIRAAATTLGLASLGLLAVVLFLIIGFAASGTLEVARWTNFTYPAYVLTQMKGVRFEALFEGFLWFVPRWAPLAALAFFGITATSLRRDRLALGLAVWVVVGYGVLLLQRFSYWQYHYMLFTVPIGVLAARGVESLAPALGAVRASRLAVMRTVFLVALLCSWAILSSASKALYFVRDDFLMTDAGRTRSHLRYSGNGVYGKVLDEVRFLSEPTARPGDIFDIGNPLFTYLAGRGQAGPRNPSMLMEYMTPAEWEKCANDVIEARPAYVFIHRDFTLDHSPVFENSVAFRRLLDERFGIVRTSPVGTWYAPFVPDSASAAAPIQAP